MFVLRYWVGGLENKCCQTFFFVCILGRKCTFKDVNSLISRFPHQRTDMKCAFVDTCRQPATFSMLSLTCTTLYSRHHPRVSRPRAGLKGVGTSFIALTADLETVQQLSSSSFWLQSDVALNSCLTITSAGIVVCTLSGLREGTDCGFYSETISTCNNSWRPKANFGLVDQQVPPAWEESRVLRGGGPTMCRGDKQFLWTQGLVSHLACLVQFKRTRVYLL